LNLSKLIILGAGHFGQRALIKCNNAYPQCQITIVDTDECRLEKSTQSISCKTVCDDGISYLNTLPKDNIDESLWIIPSIPIHVAFEWVKVCLPKQIKRLDIPDIILEQLPNVIPGKNGTVYMSYATFRCPDNCPEPFGHCFFTKQPRPISLYEKLHNLVVNNFSSIVLGSIQLLPGVGGFQFCALNDMLIRVASSEKPVLLSTACRCHGVMDAFV
jgi:hypothetical protein